MMRKTLIAISLIGLFIGCTNDNGNLPSVEERVAEAIRDLRTDLVAPTNGWRLDYRPVFDAGTFLILMDFSEDGTVRIQSDVQANNGEFRDQVISYRIDSSQGLELILETYGVFHYLFELNQATFGAEFEFDFNEVVGDSLFFTSKTDGSELAFGPATSNDENLISTGAESSLAQGVFQTGNLAQIGNFGTFNIYLPADDATISATFNLDKRIANIHGIAAGQTQSEIATNNSGTKIDFSSTYGYIGEAVVLDQPSTFSFGGKEYTISELPVENFSQSTGSFCAGQTDSLVNLSSNGVPSLGNISLQSSLFQTHSNFQGPDAFFSINHVFLYDQDDNSISGQIEAVFPDVAAFQWYYGLELDTGTFNGAGFVTVDDLGAVKFYLRGFDLVQSGNYLTLTFNDSDLITDEDIPDQLRTDFEALMDQILDQGNVYMLDLTTNIPGLWEFYNPCNRYKGFMFEL